MTDPRYVPAGFFMVRAPALPASVHRELTAPGRDTAQESLRLTALPAVRRALEAASPALLEGLDRAGEPGAPADRRRRAHAALLRYLTRMSTRPTPYGCFAGVAIGELDDRTDLRLGAEGFARERVRPDMGWLMALVERVETGPGTPGAEVVWNALAHRSGERVVLPQADVYGRSDRRAIRVRWTPAVQAVMDLTATPAPYEKVRAELTAAFPDAAPERLSGLLAKLLELNYLMSSLRPPLTRPAPEEHVLERLDAAGGPCAAVADELREVRRLAVRAERGGASALAELRARQRAMTPGHTGETCQVDAALDVAAARLHRRVAAEVAEAVGLLARLSAAVDAPEPLRGYHDRFLERYGIDVPVPVRELLDPATGLGRPAHDAGQGGSHGGGGLGRYERVLLETLTGACRDGADQVELTDALVRRLLGDRASSADGRPPMPSVDVYLQLAAADAGAVDRGEYLAVLNTHGLAPGGCTFGRFADLFTPAQRDRLADYIRHRERRAPHAAVAELAYLPSNGRAGNVAVRPRIHRYEIPVNVSPSAPPDDVIGLDDICVGASHDRFYLWSRRLGRELVIAESHMLSAAVAPDVARFLIEVSQMRYRRITAFSWESLESGPYLPRVVRGRVVLRPAEWGLSEAPPGDGPFAGRLDAWRRRWRVPRHVYLVDEDNRLLLDLEHPDCRAELGRELAKGPVRLQEMLPGAGDLWVRDTAGRPYVTELVLPLTCEAPPDPPVPAEAVAAAARAPRRVARPRLLPGGAWSFVKLYADLERHDEIIAGPLRELAEDLGPVADRWFYLRYTDPGPHLRVRFRAAGGADPRAVLDRLLDWGRRQVEHGLAADLAVAAYDPEVARYGGPAVHDAIEQVFTAGSRSAAAILDLVWSGRLDLDRELLTVAVLDRLYGQWGLGPAERLAAVPAAEADDGALALYRPRRKFLADLLVPWDAHPEPPARAVHALLEPLLAEQAAAVSAAARAVRRAAAEGELWGTEHDILLSLAHMTVNRMAGTDRAGEERSYAIWKHVLKMIGGRPS